MLVLIAFNITITFMHDLQAACLKEAQLQQDIWLETKTILINNK